MRNYFRVSRKCIANPTCVVTPMTISPSPIPSRSIIDALDALTAMLSMMSESLSSLVESQNQINEKLGRTPVVKASSAVSKLEQAFANCHVDSFFYFVKGEMYSSADLAREFIESFTQGVVLYLGLGTLEIFGDEKSRERFRRRFCMQLSHLMGVHFVIAKDEVDYYLK